jgi:hypothetical protein
VYLELYYALSKLSSRVIRRQRHIQRRALAFVCDCYAFACESMTTSCRFALTHWRTGGRMVVPMRGKEGSSAGD